MAWEINRSSAVCCFFIEDTAERDVVRDVGDSDEERPSSPLLTFGIDCIVKVLGILAIDGDERYITHISAADQVFFLHLFIELI